MTAAACSDQEFIKTYRELQSSTAIAKALGISQQNVRRRRRTIEKKYGIVLPQRDSRAAYNTAEIPEHQTARAKFTLRDGQIIVFSDAHYFPGEATTAHRGLLKIIKQLKPAVVVCNGDAFDGSTISRWPRIGWDSKPTVKSELDAVDERLTEIEKAAIGAKFFWPLGNHDSRFECFLVARAPEFQGVSGLTLKERFPRWAPCWSVSVNENTLIKHRWANGIHAAYNNTLRGGWSIITGHLHSLKVTPWTDLNGDRYGVDTGTLADPWGAQFTDYMEENPRNWRAGFCVLTYVNGKLMPPELAQVVAEGKMFFRGQIVAV